MSASSPAGGPKAVASRTRRAKRAPFRLLDLEVEAGTSGQVDLPVAQLYTHTELTVPLEVVHGRQDGPVLLISAALHGDELNGVEVIRRVRNARALRRLRGTLILAPVVNVFGFIHKSRYLPDRRDLNRCFPGSERGSLGSRMAAMFCRDVLSASTHLLDLHTGAIHRSNLPQVRADCSDPAVLEYARAFGMPVILDSPPLEGSLRAEAGERGIPALVFEGGEALRYEEESIRAGVRGCLSTMRFLGMLPPSRARTKDTSWEPVVARSSQWVRADQDGVFRPHVRLGARVKKDDVLGIVGSPMGEDEVEVVAPAAGVVVGCNRIPLVNEGEALFHIARFEALGDVARGVEEFVTDIADAPAVGTDPPLTT